MDSENFVPIYRGNLIKNNQLSIIGVKRINEILKILHDIFGYSENYFRQRLFDHGDNLYITEDVSNPDKPVISGIVLYNQNHDDSDIYITFMAVPEKYRRRGIGKFMLRSMIIDLLRESKKMHLHYRDKPELKEFYKGLGFESQRDGLYHFNHQGRWKGVYQKREI